MKAVIIDDEKKARTLLRVLLTENCPDVEEIEEAENLQEGVRVINKFKPDIVFLDIEMPGYSGIQLLDFFNPEQINFELIFTTAYSQYAIKAFEMNAIDYLLKPLRPEQVEQAVQKAIKITGKNHLNKRLEELKNSIQSNTYSKIAFPINDGVLFVTIDDIISLTAERMYTQVYTKTDGDFLVSKPLKFFLDTLEHNKLFFKPHRSAIINLKYIKRYVNKDGGYVIMDNNQMVTVAKEKKKELFDILQSN